MHRRNLILRRFGALSFGLGYFDAGTWIDHTALPDCGRDLAIAGVVSAADRSAIHALLSCCTQETDGQAARVTAIPIRSGPTGAAPILQTLGTDVDAVARRSSAR
jgi:hypothetical protein